MITSQTETKATGEFVSRSFSLRTFAARSLPLRPLLLRSGKLVAALLILALALPTGLVAVSEGTGLIPLPYNLHLVDVQLPGIFKIHMLASGAALVLIPAVLALRRYPAWHRPLGRIAAVLVVAGALTSFPVAYESSSVLPARIGFAAQGIVWLGLLIAAVVAIRNKDRRRHATLMLAMAAVASGAIWVRLTTAVVVMLGLPFDPVYACVTWLGWLVPLAIVLSVSPPLLPRHPPARAALAT